MRKTELALMSNLTWPWSPAWSKYADTSCDGNRGVSFFSSFRPTCRASDLFCRSSRGDERVFSERCIFWAFWTPGLASKDILNHSFKQSRCAEFSPHELACLLSLTWQTPGRSLHLMWFIAGSQDEKLYKKLEAGLRQRTAARFFGGTKQQFHWVVVGVGSIVSCLGRIREQQHCSRSPSADCDVTMYLMILCVCVDIYIYCLESIVMIELLLGSHVRMRAR